MFKMAASAQEKAFCVLEFAKTTPVSSVQRHFRTRYGKKIRQPGNISTTGTSVERAGLSI
jgi:NADH:ubiquinone oxidoreductase subunit F (NADH-binding)